MVLFCGTVQNAQDPGLVIKWDTGTMLHRSRSKSLSVEQSFGENLFDVFVIVHGKPLQSILLFSSIFAVHRVAPSGELSIETLSENLLPTLCEFNTLGSDFGFGCTQCSLNFLAPAASFYNICIFLAPGVI